ncbi:DEAD/DEAH box helicase [Secundilactobacillus paracollinoides]|uniref:Helicase n=1 Tax=Secundilactobacillus paracollinoides TaxID=240427 RepID=A0A1B2J1V4_9LACO|nr:DEAD/DEAH box helicase [Secundilactobacillus paracollinoides]ANZ68281.1 helicase [Secundilactobacillus paracollinoides]
MITEFEKRFEKLGFDELSPIQSAVYEPMKKGDSVLGLAPTGSGKTLGFVVPMLERIAPGMGIQAMIIAPSQELAMQLTNVTRSFAQLVDLKVTALTGGANIKNQFQQLKKHPEIVVGTPGRIQNLADEHKLKMSDLQTVIIDEADDLLAGETLDTVRYILQSAPSEVQLGFFSATETPILQELEKWFGQPVTRYDVRDIDTTQGEVRHGLLTVSNFKKAGMLSKLATIKQFKALVFFSHMGSLQQAKSWLVHHHAPVATLTANQRQTERQKALTDFRLGRVKLLLSTDVAARGLDIAKLPAVVNYEIPRSANAYTHRTGRTGRMGEPGQVINFGDDHDFRDLERMLKDTDYALVPIYYNDHQLTTTPYGDRNEADTQAQDTDMPVVHAANDNAAGKATSVSQERGEKTPVKRDIVAPASSKRHKKNKHSKRKGMRHKRQD